MPRHHSCSHQPFRAVADGSRLRRSKQIVEPIPGALLVRAGPLALDCHRHGTIIEPRYRPSHLQHEGTPPFPRPGHATVAPPVSRHRRAQRGLRGVSRRRRGGSCSPRDPTFAHHLHRRIGGDVENAVPQMCEDTSHRTSQRSRGNEATDIFPSAWRIWILCAPTLTTRKSITRRRRFRTSFGCS